MSQAIPSSLAFWGLARIPTARTVGNWLRQFTQATIAPLAQLKHNLVIDAVKRLALPRGYFGTRSCLRNSLAELLPRFRTASAPVLLVKAPVGSLRFARGASPYRK
jgi:hypothetical protein